MRKNKDFKIKGGRANAGRIAGGKNLNLLAPQGDFPTFLYYCISNTFDTFRKKEREAEKCIRPIASAEKFKIVNIILVIFLGFSFLANNENKICILS